MPIKFSCPSCGSTLRVPDEAVGKKAACPKCQTVSVIPSPVNEPKQEESFAFDSTPNSSWNVDGFQESNNPFQTPQDLGHEEAEIQTSSGMIQPTKISFGLATRTTYQTFSQNMGGFLLILVPFILFFVFSFVINLALEMMAQNPNLAQTPMFLIGYFIVSLTLQVINFMITLGALAYLLKLVKTGQASLGDYMIGVRKFVPCLLYSIIIVVLFWIPVGIVMLALVTMGLGMELGMGAVANGVGQNQDPVRAIGSAMIIWAGFAVLWGGFLGIRLGWGVNAIIDQNAGVFQSFGISWRISRRNMMTLFLVFLFHAIVLLLLIVCTCGIGAIVASPYGYCLWTVCYLLISGQLLTKRRNIDVY